MLRWQAARAQRPEGSRTSRAPQAVRGLGGRPAVRLQDDAVCAKAAKRQLQVPCRNRVRCRCHCCRDLNGAEKASQSAAQSGACMLMQASIARCTSAPLPSRLPSDGATAEAHSGSLSCQALLRRPLHACAAPMAMELRGPRVLAKAGRLPVCHFPPTDPRLQQASVRAVSSAP